MTANQPGSAPALLGFGLAAFLVATLSIFDMYLPRPYDGVVLEADAPGQLSVRKVVPGSGADVAGIHPGDRIVGIARSVLRSTGHAASLLNQHEIGETVPYLVRTGANRLEEVQVELGRRRIGDTSYLYACLLGFSFFFIGLFVVINQPRARASQLFFVLCCLFLLFLICRMRPASYSWVDVFVLNTGTAALLFLPPTFLHFFSIFPHPIWKDGGIKQLRFLNKRWALRLTLATMYLVPPLIFLASIAESAARRTRLALISGAPRANWWVLAASIFLGLFALAASSRRLPASRQREGAGIVFFGSLFGLLPFVVLAVAFPSFLDTEQFMFYGIIPLILVPLTFAYAIVRFQLLNINVILRKSLLYTVTTAVVTLFYAVGIASFNVIFRETEIATSWYFPIVFALTIVLLFEPLRHRIQIPIDRFFLAHRARLQSAMMEMGEAFTAQLDPAAVVRELVENLPKLLELKYAALYLVRGDRLERLAGPPDLPATIPLVPELLQHLREQPALTRIDDLGSLRVSSASVDALISGLDKQGVELIGDLASPRRSLGLVLLSGKEGRMSLEDDDLRLTRGLLHQAAIALETSMLLEERARQAELETEVEIAAAIQSSLLPAKVTLGEGWDVAAVCRPARQVGGDFFAELPGHSPSRRAIIYGDVSGKSVSGALMMMAAKEALHSLASTHSDPEELFLHANARLYELWKRSFVALGYFTCDGAGTGLRYLVAGQPQPLKRTRSGEVVELPLATHRLPLGAMAAGRYRALDVAMEPGEFLVAYSDGVIEAQSPSGEFFGSDRLASLIQTAPSSPREVIDHLLAEVSQFTNGTEAYDDITLLVISRQEVALA